MRELAGGQSRLSRDITIVKQLRRRRSFSDFEFMRNHVVLYAKEDLINEWYRLKGDSERENKFKRKLNFMLIQM